MIYMQLRQTSYDRNREIRMWREGLFFYDLYITTNIPSGLSGLLTPSEASKLQNDDEITQEHVICSEKAPLFSTFKASPSRVCCRPDQIQFSFQIANSPAKHSQSVQPGQLQTA